MQLRNLPSITDTRKLLRWKVKVNDSLGTENPRSNRVHKIQSDIKIQNAIDREVFPNQSNWFHRPFPTLRVIMSTMTTLHRYAVLRHALRQENN